MHHTNFMKIGTIDGLSFEISRSHQVQSLRDGYNNLRSHGYMIAKLAEKLGTNELSFSTDSGTTGQILSKGDDFNYTMDEMPNLTLTECTHTAKAKWGILVQTLVDPRYIQRLHDFVDSVDHLYIYSSDYEYELRKNTFNLKFLFEFMRNPGYDRDCISLVEKIKSKLVVAFCGWYHIARITPGILGINCEFIPQVINPNIPVKIHSFNRPYDGFFMGMNERTIDFMKKSNNKKFISIQYRDYSVPHLEYRNIVQVQQAGICTDIPTMQSIGCLSKFHCITNSWKNLYPELEQNSDMFVNQTFKIFEAYYCGMYPINPAQDWDAAMLYLDANENQYNELMKHFIAEFEHNYSASKWIPELDKYLV